MTRPAESGSPAASRRVLVASTSRLYGEAAMSFLRGLDGWDPAGPLTDGLEVLGEIARRPPEAVLILHDTARLGPGPLAGQVRRRWPEVSVIVVGAIEAPHARVLPPEAGGDDVLAALAGPPVAAEAPDGPSAGGLERLRSLTPRERDVLRLLASGAPRREIAVQLGTSPHTLRTHIHNLYRKLDAHSHLDIVRFAAQHGLVETGPEDARR